MLFIGSIVVGMISISIYKIYHRLMVILKITYKLGDDHVFPLVKKELDYYTKLGNVNILIGIFIPLILTIIPIAVLGFMLYNYSLSFFIVTYLIILPTILFTSAIFSAIKS